jgi:hypothetical protein
VPRSRIAVHSAALLAACVASIAAPPPPRTSIVDLLQSLIATGFDVLYSSELVPPDLAAPAPLIGADAMAKATAALEAQGLQLRNIGDRRYVVTRAATSRHSVASSSLPSARALAGTEPLEEVSVFASRYVFDSIESKEAMAFDERVLRDVPGAQSDTVRALRLAPGLAANLSARPFIRGALLGDVMVRYDGIPMVDPFHFKDFQRLLSAFDPFAVGRADVYTGGFPVKYGSRSGGVLDLAPRSIEAGQEYLIGISRLSNDLATVGRAGRWPIEWLATLRLSSDDSVLQPVDGEFGEPAFLDALARIRWQAGPSSALTLGWLALDDRVQLYSSDRDERAQVRSRDLTGWLSWDYGPSDALNAHTSLAITNSERTRQGTLNLLGVADGSLDERRDFSIAHVLTEWTYAPRTALAWTAGAEWDVESAELVFSQRERFADPIAISFGIPTTVSVTSNQTPHSVGLGLYGSVRRRWRAFEVEVGTRLDQQSYPGFQTCAQLSPRLNLRFDPAAAWHLYGSWGKFVQPQRIDEWRSEENQATPDPASPAVHVTLGVAHDRADALHWKVEVYRNHWFVISPYFDNTLDAVSLLPELEPDRVRLAPVDAEAAGIELSARAQINPRYSAWATYTLSQTNDDFVGLDTPRSWDQRHAANFGVAWTRARTSASILVGWHSGWPRTPLTLVPAGPAATAYLLVGGRNAGRWGSHFSADLRVTRTVPLRYGELTLWLDTTNVSDRANECCVDLGPANSMTGMVVPDTSHWLPRVIDVGFSWRLRRNH